VTPKILTWRSARDRFEDEEDLESVDSYSSSEENFKFRSNVPMSENQIEDIADNLHKEKSLEKSSSPENNKEHENQIEDIADDLHKEKSLEKSSSPESNKEHENQISGETNGTTKSNNNSESAEQTVDKKQVLKIRDSKNKKLMNFQSRNTENLDSILENQLNFIRHKSMVAQLPVSANAFLRPKSDLDDESNEGDVGAINLKNDKNSNDSAPETDVNYKSSDSDYSIESEQEEEKEDEIEKQELINDKPIEPIVNEKDFEMNVTQNEAKKLETKEDDLPAENKIVDKEKVKKRDRMSIFKKKSEVKNPSVERIQKKRSSEPSRKSKSSQMVVDDYGFIIKNQESHRIVYKYESVEMYNKWELFINKYNKSKKITLKKNKLQLYAQMGIPKNFRGEAWYLISKAYILRKKTKPDFFSQLDSLTIDADVESSINRDLHRQMTNHSLFHSQVDPKTRKHRLSENHSNLYKVLKGVALFDLKTGYCQAHAPLAAVLLVHTDPEPAFWILAAISTQILPNYYENLDDFMLDMEIFNTWLIKFAKKACKILQRLHVASFFLTEWFMCAYTRTLEFTQAMHVFDIFLAGGIKVLFKVGYALLEELCLLNPVDEIEFAKNLNSLTSNPDLINFKRLLKYAQRVKISNKDIELKRKSLRKKNSKDAATLTKNK